MKAFSRWNDEMLCTLFATFLENEHKGVENGVASRRAFDRVRKIHQVEFPKEVRRLPAQYMANAMYNHPNTYQKVLTEFYKSKKASDLPWLVLCCCTGSIALGGVLFLLRLLV